MKISDDEARALAFIAALIGLAALGRWVDRPRTVLTEAAEVDIRGLAMASETVLARSSAAGGRGAKASAAARSGGARPPTPFVVRGGDSAGGTTGAAGSASPPLDLNRATAEELERLPGVGPALAARIIERRTAAGPFRTLEALDSVRGVGPALLARLKPLLRLAR